MKLTVIGFWGGYPEKGEATSCYVLEHEGFSLMLDCGSGALSRLPYYKKTEEIDAVVLSHYHHDHIADIGVLQYNFLIQNSLQNADRKLPLYGHMEDREAFDRLSHHATEGRDFNPSKTLETGPFQIDFLKTQHPVPCYGMKITDGKHVIVYTADTAFSEDWIPFCEDADLLVAECSFYGNQDGRDYGHMNSRQAAEIAERANVKELILSHLPHFGVHRHLKEDAGQRFRGKIRLAEEGLIWQRD